MSGGFVMFYKRFSVELTQQFIVKASMVVVSIYIFYTLSETTAVISNHVQLRSKDCIEK